MNKKIMSFVLAMVLGFGLGCGSLFASSYYEAGSVGSSNGAISQFGGEDGRITISADDVNFAKTQNDQLTTMFGYIAGTMTYSGSKDSIVFYDANGAKASFNVTANAETGARQYTITSLNLNGSDIAAIQQAGGLKNFLLGCGVSEDALQTPRTNDQGAFVDASGNVVDSSEKAAMVDVAWLTEAENQLSKGINMSASISFGQTGGAQVTISENKLPQMTLGTYGDKFIVLNQYNYIEGTTCLSSVISAQVKSQVDGDGASYTLEYTETVYDQYGRQDKTYSLDKDKNRVDYAIKEQKEEVDANGRKSYSWENTGSTNTGPVGQYTYSANSSVVAYTDNSTGQTYLYSGGKIDSVVTGFDPTKGFTEQGGIDVKSKYNYVGGILDNIISYNNGTAVSMTVCDAYGRQLGTVSMTDYPNLTSDQARSFIKDALNGKAGGNSPVQSICIYKDMIGMYDFTKFGYTSEQVSAMSSMNYGYNTAIGTISLTYGESVDTDTNTEDFTTTGKAAYDEGKSEGAEVHSGYAGYKAEGTRTTTTTTTVKTLTYTCSINSHGMTMQQITKEVELSRNSTSTSTSKITDVYDPAVVGKVLRTEAVNGKNYVVLSAEKVDILDGKGFQKADGEEIYVCIDELSAEEIETLKPGSTFAAAGYIDNDANGKLAIHELYAHATSNVQGMISDFMASVQNTDEYQANAATNASIFALAASQGDRFNDWKNGWKVLLNYVNGKYGEPVFANF